MNLKIRHIKEEYFKLENKYNDNISDKNNIKSDYNLFKENSQNIQSDMKNKQKD